MIKKLFYLFCVMLISQSAMPFQALFHWKAPYVAADPQGDGTEIQEKGSFALFKEDSHVFGCKETYPDYLIIQVVGMTLAEARAAGVMDMKISPGTLDSIQALGNIQAFLAALPPDTVVCNGDTVITNRRIVIKASKLNKYLNSKRFSPQ